MRSYWSWRRVLIQLEYQAQKQASKQDAAKLKSHENFFSFWLLKKNSFHTSISNIKSKKKSLPSSALVLQEMYSSV